MAKKFLYLIAIIIVLMIAALAVLQIWSKELTQAALVPTTEFVPTAQLEENAYEDPDLWYSRPGIGVTDPARWQPAYIMPESEGPETQAGASQDGAAGGAQANEETPPVSPLAPAARTAEQHDFAVFFVHPTSHLERSSWNAPFGDEEAERIARTYIRGMASPFNAANEIWAPRYRQATMGAFLTDAPEAQQAIDAAYADVLQAYNYFLSSVDQDKPIVLAGHSQGALLLLRILREEVMDSPVADRIAAAYIIGWPISVEHDLPALGLPACSAPDQSGCIMSWSSYAEPADPSALLETYSISPGFDGEMRADSLILCTNPLTGGGEQSAEMSANLGTLIPDEETSNGKLMPAAVPARCNEQGFLLIGAPPAMGPHVWPGNDYHIYDIPLFWANTQADVGRRIAAHITAAPSADVN